MSNVVDSRVVEMRFDNQHFEKNVQTSMSTLEKLKQKLNLGGAAKGLENINSASRKLDFSGLNGAVETVTSKFSALEVMAVTALANITNSAVNAGKRIVSALTIDPIKTGFQEYETQINAVQTILANTSHAGTDLNDVNRVLDDLNAYADRTIYNFTQMTRNIGTFTAAGLGLDESAAAIKGIANLAAVSGSTSQQASTAMYQLSQALANGTVNLQDWNSVVNAGMGGKVFQDALVRTAAAMKGVTEETFRANNITGSFRESISSRSGPSWLTAEVLSKTLQQFTGDLSEAELAAMGFTKEQITNIQTMAVTANDAATKVKTFTQLWDTLKESAQSGWTQTWELIVGDFEEAKSFLTEVSDAVGKILGDSAESRNNLLSGALNTNWEKMIKILNEGGITDSFFDENLRGVLIKYGHDVDGIIEKHGSLENAFRKGALSSDLLTEAVKRVSTSVVDLTNVKEGLKLGDTGDDVKKIQETLEELDFDIGSAGIDGEFGKSTEAALKAFQEMKGLKVTGIVDEETLNALKEADKAAAGLDQKVEHLIGSITELGGRENLIQALRNTFNGLLSVVKPIKEAFSEIFPAIRSEQVYQFTERIRDFTENLIISGEVADKIKRTFSGVFSILDIGKKIITSVAKSFLELASSSGVSSLATFLLDTLASLGDFFTALNNNFDAEGLSGMLSTIVSGISNFFGIATGKIESFGDVLSTVGNFITHVLGKIWGGVKTVFGWLSENFSAGDLFAGLAGGGIFVLAKKLIGLIDGIKDAFDGLFGKGEKSEGLREKFSNLLDGVHDSLQSFSTGIKIGSFVAIAASMAILSSAFTKISKLDGEGIAKSLIAMGIALGIMTKAVNGMPTNTKFSSGLKQFTEKTNLIKSGIALMAMAKAMEILSDAIVKLSDLSWGEIAKGLIGVGGGIAVMCGGLKVLDGTKISLGTSIAMLALAEACDVLGTAMQKFVGFSWDEIARGLVGMGGALGEMVIALSVLSSVGGFGAMLGGTGILIATQSLVEMANGLKSFASMSWDEITRGLVGMGGALLEVSLMTGSLGTLAGFSSLFASGAILITVQSLSEMAEGLKSFAMMTWEEITKGLIAMAGALGEVTLMTGGLGTFAGFSSLFASGAILITVQGLSELASSLQEFGNMSWGEIGKGIVAMGGALGEVAGITGGLGILAGFSSIFAAGAIFVTTQGLVELADAFGKFGSMSWDEIGRGLVAMGGALGEVAIISGALGALAGLPALLGGGAILLAVQGLGDIADALKKFGEMSWDEINKGLTAMLGALSEIALGGILNVFSGFGAGAISEISGSLGVLADSVKKWKDVTVPEDLGDNLGILAKGVKAFTFGGLGAGALTEAAPGVGAMADSIKKWKDVTVPENLGTELLNLANGVKAFTFGGWGAETLVEVAPGLDSLATAVTKWIGITVPEELGAKLSELATGVKAFTFGGSGASSLVEAAPGVGVMADSVKKWVGVTIPGNLVDNLDSLAEGVKKFTFGGSGAETINTCASALGIMADSVKKWVGLDVPDDMGTNLDSLASGVKKFTYGGSGAENLSVAATGLSTLATSVGKWTTVVIPEGLTDNLSNLAGAVKEFSVVGDITMAVSSIGTLAAEVVRLSEVNYDNISSGMAGLSTSITNLSSISTTIAGVGTTIYNELVGPLKNCSKDMRSVGSDIIDSITNGIKNKQSSLNTTMTTVISNATNAIKSKQAALVTAGEALVSKLASGIKKNVSKASDAAKSAADKAASGAKQGYNGMYKAGSYLVDGFCAGISANAFKAEAKAAAMATAALDAAKAALGIESPSKEFYAVGVFAGMGLINALGDYGQKSYKAGIDIGSQAKLGLSDAIDKIANYINTDIDMQPTIRPVIDLSNVRSGVGVIDGLFGTNPTIGMMANVRAIGSIQNANQNGTNSDVVSAINKLRADLGNINNTSYTINGVTYDDGSNVSNAVKDIVRAVRIERRT